MVNDGINSIEQLKNIVEPILKEDGHPDDYIDAVIKSIHRNIVNNTEARLVDFKKVEGACQLVWDTRPNPRIFTFDINGISK